MLEKLQRQPEQKKPVEILSKETYEIKGVKKVIKVEPHRIVGTNMWMDRVSVEGEAHPFFVEERAFKEGDTALLMHVDKGYKYGDGVPAQEETLVAFSQIAGSQLKFVGGDFRHKFRT